MPHFGALLDWEEFEALAGRIRAAGMRSSSSRWSATPASRVSRRRCSSSIRAETRSSSRASGTPSTSSRATGAHDAGRRRDRRGGGRDRRRRDGGERGLPSRRRWASATWSSSTAPTPGRRQHRPRHRRLPRAVRHRDQRAALAPLAGEARAASPTRPASTRGTRRPAISGSPRAAASWTCCARAGGAARRGAGRGRGGDRRGDRADQPGDPARRRGGGAFCPTDGFIRPLGFSRATSRRRARLGVRRDVGRGGARGSGATRRAGSSSSRPPAERLAVGAVVNAAGPWAARGGRAGRRDAAGDAAPPPDRDHGAVRLLPADMPMTIWAGDGFHLRVRDGRVLLLWPTPGVPGRPFERASTRRGWTRSRHGARAGAGAPRRRRSTGRVLGRPVRDVARQARHPRARADGCPNLFLINGSSGHGVMHAPALGQLLAEIICHGRASTLDVTALEPGDLRREG